MTLSDVTDRLYICICAHEDYYVHEYALENVAHISLLSFGFNEVIVLAKYASSIKEC